MRRAKPFVELSERELRAEAERLVRSGKMPSLSSLCEAIQATKTKFAPRIRRARREAQRKVVIN